MTPWWTAANPCARRAPGPECDIDLTYEDADESIDDTGTGTREFEDRDDRRVALVLRARSAARRYSRIRTEQNDDDDRARLAVVSTVDSRPSTDCGGGSGAVGDQSRVRTRHGGRGRRSDPVVAVAFYAARVTDPNTVFSEGDVFFDLPGWAKRGFWGALISFWGRVPIDDDGRIRTSESILFTTDAAFARYFAPGLLAALVSVMTDGNPALRSST